MTVKKNQANNYLVLVDGHASVFRAYYGLVKTDMRNPEGTPTWATFGFTRILFDIINKYKPKYIAVVFDTPEPTFRKEMYEQYKANRTSPPEDFGVQMVGVMDIVKSLDIPIFQKAGYEADDLIGTISKKMSAEGMKVLVMTGDHDLLQLVDDNIRIVIPDRSSREVKEYDREKIIERYSVTPEQFVDYKSIVGDSSDNIPGIQGFGPKRAVKFLNEYDTLENLYLNVEKIKSKRDKGILESNKEIAFMSQALARIMTTVPVEFNLENCYLNMPNHDDVTKVLKGLGFNAFAKSLPNLLKNFHGELDLNSNEDDDLWFDFTEEEHSVIQMDNLAVKIISTIDDLKELISELEKLEYFCVDLETTGVDSLNVEIVGIAISHNNCDEKITKADYFKNYYLPINHRLEEDINRNLPEKEALELLKPLLENDKVGKIGHNIKYEINVFSNYGIKLQGIKDDTIVADYVLDPAKLHGLKEISKEYLNYEMTPIKDLIGTGKKAITMDKVEIDRTAKYAVADSAITLELSFLLNDKLFNIGLINLYKKIDLPLVEVLAKMEQNGIMLNVEKLKTLSEKLSEGIKSQETEIYRIAGKEFNINSPKQLGVILFEDLEIPTKGIKKTKAGGYSTNADILEKLAKDNEIVQYILEYRQLSKLKSTYVDALPKLTNPKTKKIHTSFNQTNVATGRLSSNDPNLQNIPIKSEIGSEIRAAFIPSEGNQLLALDYSQIELRLLAHYTEDPIFLEGFNNNLDIHSTTAMKVFDIEKIEDVTPDQRRVGKTVNFGIIYGQSVYGLSQKLNIPRSEAKEIIEKFNETYETVNKYMDYSIKFAEEYQCIETLFKRRRYIPEMKSTNRMVREFGKRIAMNTPLQGTAADLLKMAMLKIQTYLEKNNLKTKMLLQVHDELVFEVPKDELETVEKNVRDLMENVYSELKVPLVVSSSTGESWKEAK